MVLLLHGAAGGWDELLIAAVGIAVLWVAVKLAGRKPATEDDDIAQPSTEEQHDPATPTAPKLG